METSKITNAPKEKKNGTMEIVIAPKKLFFESNIYQPIYFFFI